MRILQVSTHDIAGGAEKVAWNLFQAYTRRGHISWLAVGFKHARHQGVYQIPNNAARPLAARLGILAGKLVAPLGRYARVMTWLSKKLTWAGQPGRRASILRGEEDFNFPATWRLLDLPPQRPDLLHCHNLHGDYFDLNALPWLTRQLPVALTLHDAWLLSGHCAHSFACQRWQTGCGSCPNLAIPPPLAKDQTEFNWQRKKQIYAQSRLYVSAPSQWLLEKAKNAILAQGIVNCRLIPNGIDLALFHPADRLAARQVCGLSPQARIILFTANTIRQNIWKDFATLEAAVSRVAQDWQASPLVFVALGEQAADEQIGQALVHFVPYQKDPLQVAAYYQAADLYIHAARADTFPNTVLEALACGTPVVATAVGGIPEQVVDGETGFLVPPGDAASLAKRILQLLNDAALCQQMRMLAAEDAQRRFDLERQVNDTLAWYGEILEAWTP